MCLRAKFSSANLLPIITPIGEKRQHLFLFINHAFPFQLTIDGLATSAVEVGEVTTLKHELGNDTVEDAVLVTVALLASAKSTEVLGSLRHNLTLQLKRDALSYTCM